jgi:hypothetical protein
MTWCANDVNRINGGLPLEVCFKAQGSGETILKNLNVPSGMSVRFSDSGSYREEHVYCCLQTHLPLATPERRKANDWRLLYLDIYSGHLSMRLFKLCWDRMYLMMYHGGGLTGLCQPNDTWLHWLFERKMLNLEAVDVLQALLLRPNKVPTQSRQDILDNASKVWFCGDIPHERSRAACKSIGFSLALDGSEAQGPLTELHRDVLRCALQCTVLFCVLCGNCCTVLYCTVVCCAVLRCAALRTVAQHSKAQQVATQNSKAQHS